MYGLKPVPFKQTSRDVRAGTRTLETDLNDVPCG
jgi:hypothetical protein